MAEFKILTDATVDLPPDMYGSLGITILPMIVDVNGTDYRIQAEKSEIDIVDFYARLDKGEIARTSQVSNNDFYEYISAEFKKGFDVLMISFSSGLSTSYEGSVVVAERLKAEYPDRKAICIDSRTACGGYGILIHGAVRRQRQGMSLEEVAKWVEDNKMLIDHWVTVDELDTLYRGGRISRTSAAMGSMLNIKPIIHINREGRLISVGKVRGRKKALQVLADEFRTGWDGGDDMVMIGYGGSAMDEALALRETLMADGGPEEVYLAPVGVVVGAHTGSSVIAVFFHRNDLRQDSK